MPPRTLNRETSRLQSDCIETMQAGHPMPASNSDWQYAWRALFELYDIKRRPRPVRIDDFYAEDEITKHQIKCSGCGCVYEMDAVGGSVPVERMPQGWTFDTNNGWRCDKGQCKR